MTVFERLSEFLTVKNAPFEVLRHAPVFTSEEAAAVRGTPLASGAKALVCKLDEQFVLIVVLADRKLASSRIRKQRRAKSLRFATREEVMEKTGLAPGSIPPFGRLFGLPTWCDERLAEAGTINFNAGDHAISISMTFESYRAAESPELGQFAE
jgi:Ala-tRNA(Pro) deacylase